MLLGVSLPPGMDIGALSPEPSRVAISAAFTFQERAAAAQSASLQRPCAAHTRAQQIGYTCFAFARTGPVGILTAGATVMGVLKELDLLPPLT